MKKPDPFGRQIAGNDARWPDLASLLAPAAGCDCQILAVTIADDMNERHAAAHSARSAPVRY